MFHRGDIALKPTFLTLVRATSLLAACVSPAANAYLVTITAGTRALYLQVGAGNFSGRYTQGGTPGDNSTINSVSVTVPAAALGTGSQAMTSNSAVAISPYDNYNFCSPPAQVYVGGFYRVPGAGGNATLSVTTPPSLVNATADTIPFSTISWISGGNGDPVATIPSGTFTGAAQTLLSVGRNSWFESCLTFNYSNAAAYAAGTFSGRAVYTLSAP
jgi:hypothetical protein